MRQLLLGGSGGMPLRKFCDLGALRRILEAPEAKIPRVNTILLTGFHHNN